MGTPPESALLISSLEDGFCTGGGWANTCPKVKVKMHIERKTKWKILFILILYLP